MKNLLLIGILLSTVGCAHVRSSQIGEAYPPKPSDCAIDVYQDAASVTHKYVAVCMIDSKSGVNLFHDYSIESVIARGKKVACQKGCDAVIIQNAQTSDSTYWKPGASSASLLGIKYTDQ
ncbi:MAG TPA: hypothetical protein VK859_09250 [bacterium]|jgi:hypothetical protein|nr:hypothetical protein [bacterium]